MDDARGLLLAPAPGSGPAGVGQMWSQSESDIPSPATPGPLPSAEITYSEPGLDETQTLLAQVVALANGAIFSGLGHSTVPAAPGPSSPREGHGHGHHQHHVGFAPSTPQNSLANVGKLLSIDDDPNCIQKRLDCTEQTAGQSESAAAAGANERPRLPVRNEEHKESFTERDYHSVVQQEHRKNRRRHFTDPVDFEGILHIIGGCGWWQIWIYLLISMQQVHASAEKRSN